MRRARFLIHDSAASDIRWLRFGLLVFLALQLMLTGVYLDYEYRRTENEVYRTLTNTAVLYAKLLDQSSDYVRLESKFIAYRALTHPNYAVTAGLHGNALIDAIFVLDKDGHVYRYASNLPLSAFGIKLDQNQQPDKSSEFFHWHGDAHKTHSELILFDKHYALGFGGLYHSQAIYDEKQNLLGRVISVVGNSHLSELLESNIKTGFSLGRDGRILIYDQNSKRVLYQMGMYNGAPVEKSGEMIELILLRESSSKNPLEFYYYSDVDKHNRIAVLTPLHIGANEEWQQVISLSQHESFRSWYAQIAIVLILFVLAAILQWQVVHGAYRSHQQRSQLVYEAGHDPLTNLVNRRYFMEWSDNACKHALRYRSRLSVLAFDIDFFKKINDEWGHDMGDRVLIAVADTIGTAVRDCDVAARFGGEEFIVALPETGLEDAQLVAERIRCNIAALRFAVNSADPIRVTISIGVTALREDEASLESALARADAALYAAKEGGRNRVVAEA